MRRSEFLKDIAIYLEGLKAGRGNLNPLGFMHLEELWHSVRHFQDIESREDFKLQQKKAKK